MATKNIMQLTPNPAPALTDLIEVDDGAGNSFSETLTQVLGLRIAPNLNVTWTGVLPLSFPHLHIVSSSGFVQVTVNGDNPIIPLNGVNSDSFLIFSDPDALLTSLSFNNLVGLTNQGPNIGFNNNVVAITSCPALTSLSFPMLEDLGGSYTPATMASLTTLSTPALAYVGGNYGPGTMASLTTLSTPALAYVGGSLNISIMAALTSVSMPSLLNVVGSWTVATMASLTTISLPAMVSYGSTIAATTGLGNLTTVTLGTPGTLKRISGATINISGQKLDQASVNGILALLVSLDGTGGTTLWGAGKTVNLSGGTSAAPSGQGIINKATLVARTATVTTN